MEEFRLTAKDPHSTPNEFANLNALFVVDGEVSIDNQATHAKSKWERGIQFERWLEKSDPPSGKRIPFAWLSVRRQDGKMVYNGLVGCVMWVDMHSNTGYKNLADHVNKMEYAIKGRVDLSSWNDEEKRVLLRFLKEYDTDAWERSNPDVKALESLLYTQGEE